MHSGVGIHASNAGSTPIHSFTIVVVTSSKLLLLYMVRWPGVVRERALNMHSFRHGAEMLLAREDCRKVCSAD
jgi:hypothetical protein